MGLETHAWNLMKYARRRGSSFRRVATLGRQWGLENAYCEGMIKREFSSEVVDSFDNSGYERATHIADLGAPMAYYEGYDTVFDGGTLEHIYNIPQALLNASMLCKPGGQILHVLPANNMCGHGFWQFSPELFFSLYREPNGYTDTEVFLADFLKPGWWLRCATPANGHRIMRRAPGEHTCIIVRTVRGPMISHAQVYQSDYVHAWGGGGIDETERPEDFTLCNPEEL